GQVAGHRVHGVGKLLPRAATSGDLRLPAEFTVGAHFAGHAGHFGGERTQLVHHRVDGVFEFENFASYVDRNFAGQIATRDGGGNFCDVADLTGEVSGH